MLQLRRLEAEAEEEEADLLASPNRLNRQRNSLRLLPIYVGLRAKKPLRNPVSSGLKGGKAARAFFLPLPTMD